MMATLGTINLHVSNSAQDMAGLPPPQLVLSFPWLTAHVTAWKQADLADLLAERPV